MEASVTGGKEEDNKNNNVATGYSSNNVKKARLQSTMATLLNDPILTDVPKKPTLSDVDNLISLELGSAMRISILKLDGTSLGTSNKHTCTHTYSRSLSLLVILTNI
ncbi:hypothetical protein CsSME_00036372 [Camellia sinensis var. sinensis]